MQGDCTIHLPWYGKRQWTKIEVRVKPVHDNYQIRIDSELCRHKVNGKGLVVTEVPPLNSPIRRISIECGKKRKWKLLEVSCELAKNEESKFNSICS